MKKAAIYLIASLICISFTANANRHKTISTADGLSNSAILSINQDDLGHIYIGTADGLNIWNGKSVEIFESADGYNYFHGNMIRHIYKSESGKLFLLTNYGLAKIDTKTRDINFYNELAFYRRIAITDEENIFAMDENNVLYYFNTSVKEITAIPNFSLPANEVCHRMVMADDGRLCIFTNFDIYLVSFNGETDTTPSIKAIKSLNIKCKFIAPSYDERHHGFITEDNRLYNFDGADCSVEHITEIKNFPSSTDNISGIILTKGKCYISFRQEGLYILNKGKETLERTEIDFGIFSMIKDNRQPIIWIGTDCNGLICYSLEETAIRSLTFDQMPYSMKMPIRSIFLDRKNNLWFGTKGDGLYRIRNFTADKGGRYSRPEVNRFMKENTGLTHNSIYSIIEGHANILWIGTEGNGLNWWSEMTKQINVVEGSENISLVHCMIEQNDSTLWISTDGQGAYKCRYEIRNGAPVITQIDTLPLGSPFNFNTSIFAMAMENDSTIWFGSRGKGAMSYDISSGKSQTIQFPTDRGFATNEIFFISKTDYMLFATGNGLVAYDPQKDSVFVSEDVPFKATHAIMSDNDGNIWISTNSGLTSLDKNLNYKTSYDNSSGLAVLEYSDGACYYDRNTDQIFFGGVNGLTVINNQLTDIADSVKYIPEINITNFIQNNEYCHISQKMKKGRLKIPYSKSLFAIQFSVVDNLHYSDYKFSRQLKGLDDRWTDVNSDIIYIPALDPGRYLLKIKYENKSTSYESEECCLPIYIVPPFYRSILAQIIYLLLLIGIIYLTIIYFRRRQALMKERIHKKYSDEIMKIKSDTTGTITEELSVQITFILALCQQIKQHSQNNSFVSDKVNLVEYNVAKINKMLNIFTEYKGVSDTFANTGEVVLIPISQISTEVLDLMKTRVSDRKIILTYDIEDGIVLAMNKEAFLIVIYSLINKAISIATGQKTIHLNIKKLEDAGIVMTSTVTTEKEKYQELKSAIRMNDKEDFELFVCKMIVDRLGGNLAYSYAEDKMIATMRIQLPSHQIENNPTTYIDTPISEGIYTHNTIIENELSKRNKHDAALNYIYLVSNNKDISSFMEYFLSNKYNILVFNDNESMLEQTQHHIPVAAIYDTLSIANGFPAFIEKIRSNRRTEQIIIIAMTSSLQVKEREECTKLGADLCISFPFNIDYLNSALEKLLLKRESIAEYYKSPMSTYVIDKGKIIHSDDKAFLDKVFKFIHKNIANPTLTAPAIAKYLGMSTRVMYRRLEGITDKKLHMIIKESRMQHATKLLTSSKLSIDEIMYRVGYENRSTFYRNFKETYGITPKEYRDNVRSNVMKSLNS